MSEAEVKPYKVMNVQKTVRIEVMAASLMQLIEVARKKFNFAEEDQLILILEEDKTEIQDEDYFQTLE